MAVGTSRGFPADLGDVSELCRKAPKSCDLSMRFFKGVIPLDNPRLRKQLIYYSLIWLGFFVIKEIIIDLLKLYLN